MTASAQKTAAPATTSSGLASALVVVGLVVVFVGQRVLAEGTTSTVVTLAGAVAVLGAIAWKTRSFRAATGAVRRVEAALLCSYAGVAAALAIFAFSNDRALAEVGLAGTAAARTSGASYALFLVVLTVSLSGLLFLELAYRRMPIAPSVPGRGRSHRSAIAAACVRSGSMTIIFVPRAFACLMRCH